MYIGVTADGNNLKSNVAETFEQCEYLLIIDVDNLNIKSIIENKKQEESDGLKLADEIIKNDCEAVITGKIQSSAFNILADAYITRFFGTGSSVEKTIELMDKNKLILIKSCEGSEDCGGHHHN
ncbi:MAG: NifB/NifX family molybdenum-iron cluster-binding protein [Solirubrobacterales bacterium]